MEGDFVLNISAPAPINAAKARRPQLSQQKKRPREQRSGGTRDASNGPAANAAEQKPKLIRPMKKQQGAAGDEEKAPASFVKRPKAIGARGPKATAQAKAAGNEAGGVRKMPALGGKPRPLHPSERPPIRLPPSNQKRPISMTAGSSDEETDDEAPRSVALKQRPPPKKAKHVDTGLSAVPREESEDTAGAEVENDEEVVPQQPEKASRKRPAASDTRDHHLKPSALSKNALLKPKTAQESRHLFTESSFESLGLCERLVGVLTKPSAEGGFGFESATKVQSVAVPALLRNTKALIKSETGSGKTLTYLLPLIQDLQSWNPRIERSSGTWGIILAPTRELSVQIFDVLSQLTSRFAWLVPSMITGGEKRKSEKARLRKGVTIIVATPGRLLDHLQTTESFECSNLRWLILDEADRLLDLGFEKQLNAILDILLGRALEQLAAKEAEIHDQSHRGHGGQDADDDEDSEEKSATPDDEGENEEHEGEDTATGRGQGNKKGGKPQGPVIVLPALGDKKLYTASQRWHARKALESKSCSRADQLHIVLASATLTPAVGRLAGSLLEDHIYIDADRQQMESSTKQALLTRIANPDASEPSSEQATFSAPVQLRQYAMVVTCKWRLPALVSFIKQHSTEKMIVFMSTCDSVDFHMLLMRESRWPQNLDDKKDTDGPKEDGAGQALRPLRHSAVGMFGYNCPIFRLHGNLTAETRHAAFKEFSQATAGVLFCTDVAARGLDLPRVDWILQYDPPVETSDYVHRVGRTARKGACGSALLFLLPSEKEYLDVLKSHGLHADLLSLHQLLQDTTRHLPGAASFKNADEMAAVMLQRRLENTVAASRELLASAKSAFQCFLRAYSTHSSATKHIFQLRALHFGHVAKSFGMREPPSAIRVSGTTLASASKPLKESNKKQAKTPAPSGKFRKGTGSKAAAEFAA